MSEPLLDYDKYFKDNMLGNIYACQYSWKLPTVVQVIGQIYFFYYYITNLNRWTKNSVKSETKIRYAYITFVELNNINHPYDNRGFGGGGESMILIDRIKRIEYPTYKSPPDTIKLKINIENGIIFLSRGSPNSSIYETFYKVNNLEVFKWEKHDQTIKM